MAIESTNQAIAEYITIARRYVRSIDVVRDVEDARALEGYVLTPAVKDALHRILNGLRSGSTSRAFRITGPYGTGKSAFGLLLARLFIEKGKRKGKAARVVETADPGIRIDDLPRYLPIIMNGRRMALSDALLDTIANAANGNRLGIGAPSIARSAADLRKRRAAGERDDVKVLETLASYAKQVSSLRGGNGGVLLLIDEMGRFLEHAAINRASDDPAFFQQLAELAGGASGPPLAIVTFIHHRFADYAAGFGEWVEAEWARSAERYEDVPFHESLEQIVFLLAQALSHAKSAPVSVATEAERFFREASARGVYSTAELELASVAPHLYPLHPATVAFLSNLARRFGQNERSVFGFLQSLEPYGFQRFIQNKPYRTGSWYRLPDFFDYLAAQGSMRLNSADRERRWGLLIDGVAECGHLTDLDILVLKSIGLLAVFEPVPGLKADSSTVAWCLGRDIAEVEASLSALVSANVLYRRPHRGDYSLWASSSVDLDGLLEEARTRVPTIRRLDETLADLPSARPAVAHRHYHKTGTLRAFSVLLWAGKGAPPSQTSTECDGAIYVIPVYPDEYFEHIIERIEPVMREASDLAFFCLQRITADDLDKAHELAVWRWISANCEELRADDFARREVQTRISEARNSLTASLDPFIHPRAGDGTYWIHKAERVDLPTKAALSKALSCVCDTVFWYAPAIKNELINRARLTAAASSARMRLLEMMVKNPGLEYLGLIGAPPERTIYLSVFKAPGIHREVETGKWGFVPPEPDPLRWRPVWDAIDSFLQKDQRSFTDLIEYLGSPPYGLRGGPAILIIAAFMLHNRDQVVLLERDTFQPEVTGAHFMRLVKTPANFSLRYVGKAGATLTVLEKLARDLTVWDGGMKPEPLIKTIVEGLYHWWNRLPACALETSRLSDAAKAVRLAMKKAHEPVALIYKQLPNAVGFPEIPVSDDQTKGLDSFIIALDASFRELSNAEPLLRKEVENAVLDAFAAPTTESLRARITRDCGPHRKGLAEYRLRAFVDRTVGEMSNDKWIDSIAGLIEGRRLEGWQDPTIDHFVVEIRALAQQLGKWLALMRGRIAFTNPVASVHVVAPDGNEEMVIVENGEVTAQLQEKLRALRKLLGNSQDARAILAQLLVENVAASKKKEPVDE
jgi:hypothetical protein